MVAVLSVYLLVLRVMVRRCTTTRARETWLLVKARQ
jgi:hypothetical protein